VGAATGAGACVAAPALAAQDRARRHRAARRPATFVSDFDNDTMMVTENSYLLAHQLFADHLRAFLNGA
jgi:hypothetical protein